MFGECRRRYYFHYYKSWGGWDSSAPPLAGEAFRLKRLTSLPLWRGQLVHYIATKVLASLRKKGRIPAAEDVIAYTDERFRRQFEFSRSRKYLSTPKKSRGRLNIDWLALFEHEYGMEIDRDKFDSTLGECITGIKGLLGSDMLSRIAETDTSGWVIENIDLAEFAQVFEFEGAQVFAKTDFIFRGLDGTFNIVDWKTFRVRDDDEEDPKGKAGTQLGVYGYYAAKILGEDLDTIRLHEVNLLDGGRAVEHKIGPGNIDLFYEHIRSGIASLASVLEDADIAANMPLGPECFPKNVSGRCRYCNFYRICEDPGSRIRLE